MVNQTNYNILLYKLEVHFLTENTIPPLLLPS